MIPITLLILAAAMGCGEGNTSKYPVFSKDYQAGDADGGVAVHLPDAVESPGDVQVDGDTTAPTDQSGSDAHDVVILPPCESETRELARFPTLNKQSADEDADEPRIEDVSALFFGDEVVVAWGERINYDDGAGYVARYNNDGALVVVPRKIFNTPAGGNTTRLRIASDGVNTLVVYDTRYTIPDDKFNGQDTSAVAATFLDANLERGPSALMSDLLDNGWNVAADSPYVFYPYEGEFMVAWSDWRMEDTSGLGRHYFQLGVYYSLISADDAYPGYNKKIRSGQTSFGSARRSMSLHEGTLITHVSKNIYLQAGANPSALASVTHADFLDYAKLGEDAWAVWTRGGSVYEWDEEGNEVRARRTAGDGTTWKDPGQCCSTEGELACNVPECIDALCPFMPQCCETWTETCAEAASFASDLCCGDGAGSGGDVVPDNEDQVTVATGGYFLGSRIVKSSTDLYLVWTENRTQEPFGFSSGDDVYELQKFKVQNLGDLESSPSTLDVGLSGKLLDIEDYRLVDNYKVELLSVRLDEGEAVIEITTMCLPK